MARPKKMRCICEFPKSMEFKPFGDYADTVNLSFDEYEAFRLIDFLDFSQDECAKQMNVARSTVAAICQSARAKIADAIVNGKALVIYGGDVELCPNHSTCCGRCGQRDCEICGHCAKANAMNDK